jgi:outer membrane biosynthesis protein TonB
MEDAGADGSTVSSGGNSSNGENGPCMGCGKGISTPELESKVAGRAGMARGCYNRALRVSEISGSLTVSVSIGADGTVCGSRIVKDTVGSPAISSCVLSKFSGTSFPRPKVGCVVINVPIAFKTKK